MPNLTKYNPPQVMVADKTRTLSFRPVSSADISLIMPYLEQSRSRSCDYTAGGLFMWIGYFGYQYCIYRDTLFIKGLSEDARRSPAFSLPLGALPLRQAVAAVRAYCAAEGIAPLFSAIPEDRIADFRALGATAVTELPDWADYIYSAADLATLPGKAYSKKRNHVHRFVADNPRWTLDDITPANIAELRGFCARLSIESAKADPVMAEYEREQCLDVLDNYDAYPFEGAILRDDSGSIVAFTAGEIVGDTLVLHIEKMEHTTAGAGEAINHFFARRMLDRHPGLVYINREDDSGDPGLRRAKESYHPDFLLRKFNVMM